MNVENFDLIIRIVVGFLLIAFAIPVGFPNIGWNWGSWIGMALIIKAPIGTCRAYSLLGVSTRAFDSNKS